MAVLESPPKVQPRCSPALRWVWPLAAPKHCWSQAEMEQEAEEQSFPTRRTQSPRSPHPSPSPAAVESHGPRQSALSPHRDVRARGPGASLGAPRQSTGKKLPTPCGQEGDGWFSCVLLSLDHPVDRHQAATRE